MSFMNIGQAVPRVGPAPRRTAITAALLVAACAVVVLPATGHARAEAGCRVETGPYQWELEAYLGRPRNGWQSAADCAAIAAFQRAEDVRPADGYAGLATYRTMLVAQARANPNAAGKCPVDTGRTACVDLDRQLMWVQEGRRVAFGPVAVRTGRAGQTTRTGRYTVYVRSKDHVSTLYANSPMPYSQFFSGGQAFHGRLGTLFDGGGSAGCVNLTVPDAQRLWDVLRLGDPVQVWGRKPGT